MTKQIAQKLTNDKRTKSTISASVLATKVILKYNNMILNLSHIDAKRISDTLTKAVLIQDTERGDNTPAPSSFSKQELIQVHKEEPQTLTTLEKRLELAKYFYRALKEYHPDLPRFRKSKIQVFRGLRNCNKESMGRANAHCHHKKTKSKHSQKICIKQKFLLRPRDSNEDLANSIGENMAHETAHLMIRSCRHCNRFWERCNAHKKSITEILHSKKFWDETKGLLDHE